jgi:hypothetical protein
LAIKFVLIDLLFYCYINLKIMKKNILIVFVLFSLILMVSCFKEKDNIFSGDGTFVEFQKTIVTTPAAGRTYPLIATKRAGGILTEQVNLVGNQRAAEESISFVVDSLTTAVAGTHYRLVGNGAFPIPANTSFGSCQVEFLNPARDSGKSVDLILRLVGNASGDIKPSENYKRIGFRMSLN